MYRFRNEYLRELRTKHEWSFADVAERLRKCGMYTAPGLVHAWERGKHFPNGQSLVELARLFGVTVNELLEDSSAEDPS